MGAVAGTASRSRYIALLRGVNVGRAKRIAMADLRKLVEDLGYTGVRSLLNSGNIVFDAVVPPVDAAQAIEAAIALHLGVSTRVFVFSCDQVAGVIDDNPLLHVATDYARLFVFLLAGEPQRALATDLCKQDWAPESMAPGRHAVYVWCPQGLLDSAAATALGKRLADGATSRNWNTMIRLHALCRAGADSPASG